MLTRPMYTHSRGFTLLELMVSIVIIGIILSFATLSLGDGGQARRLEQTVQQLTALLTLAHQEAILQGKEMGVAFTATQYYFYRWQDQDWRLLSQDDIFHPRTFPSETQITLAVEGKIIAVDKIACEEMSTCKPQLLLLSSGELTPFELTLTGRERALTYQLQGSLTELKTDYYYKN